MADRQTAFVKTLSEIPFDKMIVSKPYVLLAPTQQDIEEAKRRLFASPVAFNRRPVIQPCPGLAGGGIRLVILPAKTPTQQARDLGLDNRPRDVGGRPLGKLAAALDTLQVGQHVIAARDGRLAQTVRNIASRSAKRMNRTYRVESMKCGDPRLEWTQDMLEVYDDGDFFAITRTS